MQINCNAPAAASSKDEKDRIEAEVGLLIKACTQQIEQVRVGASCCMSRTIYSKLFLRRCSHSHPCMWEQLAMARVCALACHRTTVTCESVLVATVCVMKAFPLEWYRLLCSMPCELFLLLPLQSGPE